MKKKTTTKKPAGIPLGLAMMLAHPGFMGAPAAAKKKKRTVKKRKPKAC